MPARSCPCATVRARSDSSANRRGLVVKRLEPGGPQDRLAQPLQPEHQQQPPDHDAQHPERERGQRRTNDCNHDGKGDCRGGHSVPRGAPGPRGTHREHDRQRLDRLDGAGEEYGYRESKFSSGHELSMATWSCRSPSRIRIPGNRSRMASGCCYGSSAATSGRRRSRPERHRPPRRPPAHGSQRRAGLSGPRA